MGEHPIKGSPVTQLAVIYSFHPPVGSTQRQEREMYGTSTNVFMDHMRRNCFEFPSDGLADGDGVCPSSGAA